LNEGRCKPSYVPFNTVTVGTAALAIVASKHVANAPTIQTLAITAMMPAGIWREEYKGLKCEEAALVFHS
jgi:hypothetical protein